MPTEQPGETPTAGDVPCGLREGGGRAQLKRKRNGDDDAEFDADVDSNTGGAADSESETQKRSIGCVALSSDEALTRFDKYVDL